MARFKHLEIYQQTYKLNHEIFRIKQKLPKTLKFDLGVQSHCFGPGKSHLIGPPKTEFYLG